MFGISFETNIIVCYYFSSKCYHEITPGESCPHHQRTVRYVDGGRSPSPGTQYQYNRFGQIGKDIVINLFPLGQGGEEMSEHVIHSIHLILIGQ